jgi:hypothetical protein
MFIKVENPRGMRIQDLFVGNERVDKNKVYFTSFATVQGVPQKYGTNRRNLHIRATDGLKQFIKKKGSVSSALRGTN